MGTEVEVLGMIIEGHDRLALRAEGTEGRREAECIPPSKVLKEGCVYGFEKEGRRIFPQDREIPLVMTNGNQNMTQAVGQIRIMTITYRTKEGEVYTEGTYMINKLHNK